MNKPRIRSYGAAKEFYDNHIENQTGRYEGCYLENNTRLIERRSHREEPNYAVRLYATDVVTYHPDGRIEIRSGGWTTQTTKRRINRYTPGRVGIVQEDYQWYLVTKDRDEEFNSEAVVETHPHAVA